MNTDEYAQILIAKANELKRSSQSSKDQITIERNAEQLEQIQRTADREMALAALTRNWQSALLVQEALERIERGEFGVCAECEEPISERRLRAIPWAKFCVACQETQDLKRDPPSDELSEAA